MEIKQSFQSRLLFACRILMALMFMESFADKLMHWDVYVSETAAKHIPFPPLALGAAALTELLGSLALITGLGIRFGTLALAGYTFIVNFYYFDFWNQAEVAAIMARKEFLKNIAVVGGLLVFTAIGADRYTLHKKNKSDEKR